MEYHHPSQTAEETISLFQPIQNPDRPKRVKFSDMGTKNVQHYGAELRNMTHSLLDKFEASLDLILGSIPNEQKPQTVCPLAFKLHNARHSNSLVNMTRYGTA